MKKLAFLIAGLTACATLPRVTREERAAEAAAECLRAGPCVVVQVDNQVLYDGVVRVNGVTVGPVFGEQHATFFIRETLLRDGRCAQVSVEFRQPGVTSISSRECLREGGRFTLAVDPMYHAWLTPQGE
ncbi:MAG TPA: hypothetical protein VGD02_07650 [Gemmatimonadaceae bacterium]